MSFAPHLNERHRLHNGSQSRPVVSLASKRLTVRAYHLPKARVVYESASSRGKPLEVVCQKAELARAHQPLGRHSISTHGPPLHPRHSAGHFADSEVNEADSALVELELTSCPVDLLPRRHKHVKKGNRQAPASADPYLLLLVKVRTHLGGIVKEGTDGLLTFARSSRLSFPPPSALAPRPHLTPRLAALPLRPSSASLDAP